MSRYTLLARFCVVVLAVLLFLQSLRALFPLALFQPGLWWGTTSQLGIAAHIILLFLAPLITPLLVRLLGEARTLKFALCGLALLRLVAQFAPNEIVRIVAVSGAIICALSTLPLGWLYLRSSGDGARVAAGLLMAFALDAALNGAFYTWDYLWQSSIGATTLAVVVSALMLICTYIAAFTDDDVQGAVQQRALWMLAPFFALHITCLSNVAFIARNTGWSVPAATALVLAGSALGVVVGVQLARRSLGFGGNAAALVLVLVLAGIRNTTGVLAAGIILLGHVGAAVWMLRAWGSEKPSPPAPLPHGEGSHIASSTTLYSNISIGSLSWITAGISIVFLLLAVLLNYAGSILKLPAEWMLMPPLALLLMALLNSNAGAVHEMRGLLRAAFVPAVLLIVPFGLLLAPTQRLTARADDAVLRVMTYNIHQGIDNRGYVALEWMAQTIEAENPDIVLLQEVTRSALVNGGIDSIEWLSRRLGMSYHFFAADRQFGNATLTRLPIVSANAGLLPRNDEALNRNYVRVVVQVDGETITVINTHLDHMQRDNRMPQVERVIEIWGGEARTVMGGDLNAQPHSDEINALLAAGMVSGQDVTGNGALDTFIAFDPFLRLDWLFGSPDIRFIQSRVPESIASDHLPVVVEIALPLGN